MAQADAFKLNQSVAAQTRCGRGTVMPRTRARVVPCDAALHNKNLTRFSASEDEMSPKKSQDLMVSATGTWRVMPQADSPKRARATLPMALGVRCNATIRSVLGAINLAARDNQTSVLSLPHRAGHENEVLKVRPARETGFAIVSVEKFDGDPALPDLRLLMNLFSLTETEAEIGISLRNVGAITCATGQAQPTGVTYTCATGSTSGTAYREFVYTYGSSASSNGWTSTIKLGVTLIVPANATRGTTSVPAACSRVSGASDSFATGGCSTLITAKLLRAITVTKTSDLRFGTLMRGAGSITISPSGTRSATGLAAFAPGSTAAAAKFDITGEGGQAIRGDGARNVHTDQWRQHADSHDDRQPARRHLRADAWQQHRLRCDVRA